MDCVTNQDDAICGSLQSISRKYWHFMQVSTGHFASSSKRFALALIVVPYNPANGLPDVGIVSA